MIIFTDSKRRKELDEAKLKPYDGVIIYETTEDDSKTEYFMGYELKPYKIKRKDGIIEVGTTICHQYKVIQKDKPVEYFNPIELPDEWLQKEAMQLWEAKVWDSSTEEHRKFWGMR